jgi:uncharacterized protein YndB with AHSA1/START domain
MTSKTDSLVFERDYRVPPAKVFLAWTRIDLLSRWFGCRPDQRWKIHEWDARVGGRLHVSLDFDGKPFEVRGEFLVVDAPSKLTYCWGADEFVEVVIEPRGTGSHPRLSHTFPERPGARDIPSTGWSSSLTQLDESSNEIGR